MPILLVGVVLAVAIAVYLYGSGDGTANGASGGGASGPRGAQPPDGERGAQRPDWIVEWGYLPSNPRGQQYVRLWTYKGGIVDPSFEPTEGTRWEANEQREGQYLEVPYTIGTTPQERGATAPIGGSAPADVRTSDPASGMTDYGTSSIDDDDFPDQGWGSGELLSSLGSAVGAAVGTGAALYGGADPATAAQTGKLSSEVGGALGEFTGKAGPETAARVKEAVKEAVSGAKDRVADWRQRQEQKKANKGKGK